MNKTSLFRVTPIKLDSNGELPTRFMLVQSGNWPNSVKGAFSISVDDIKEMKQNYDAGRGFPTDDASTGLAIDYAHDFVHEAAAWIKSLEVEEFTGDDGKPAARLWASNVEWTDIGAEVIRSGRYKCVSPSGYFGKKGERMSMWPNPTNLKEKFRNILDGAGLTNIPFLRGMSPIRASAQDDELEYDKVIFVRESQQTKEKNMTIEELRVKEKTALSTEEMQYITDHKTELSADELKKFGLEVEKPVGGVQLSADEQKTLADIREGKVKVIAADQTTVSKETLDGLTSTVNQYREEKAQAVIDKHVGRGAIKADAVTFWQKQLLSASDEDRKTLETQLENLPGNEQLAKEIGSSDAASAGSAREQLNAIALQKVQKAREDKVELDFVVALREATRENPELAQLDTKEQMASAK